MRDAHGAGCVTYTRDELLSLYTTVPPTSTIVDHLREVGLWTVCRRRNVYIRRCRRTSCRPDRVIVSRYRRRRSGRRRRPSPCLQSTDNGAFIVTSRPVPTPRPVPPSFCSPSSLLRVHIDRHANPCGRNLMFGSININSLTTKLDDLLDVRRDQQIDVMFLVETHHDSDSICIRRLRVLVASKSSIAHDRVCATTRWARITAESQPSRRLVFV